MFHKNYYYCKVLQQIVTIVDNFHFDSKRNMNKFESAEVRSPHAPNCSKRFKFCCQKGKS